MLWLVVNGSLLYIIAFINRLWTGFTEPDSWDILRRKVRETFSEGGFTVLSSRDHPIGTIFTQSDSPKLSSPDHLHPDYSPWTFVRLSSRDYLHRTTFSTASLNSPRYSHINLRRLLYNHKLMFINSLVHITKLLNTKVVRLYLWHFCECIL